MGPQVPSEDERVVGRGRDQDAVSLGFVLGGRRQNLEGWRMQTVRPFEPTVHLDRNRVIGRVNGRQVMEIVRVGLGIPA